MAFVVENEIHQQDTAWITFESEETKDSFEVELRYVDEQLARRISREIQPRKRRRETTDDIDMARTAKTYAKHVVLGWRDIMELKDGKEVPFPFSVENVEFLMRERRDFMLFVIEESQRVHNFVDDEGDEDEEAK